MLGAASTSPGRPRLKLGAELKKAYTAGASVRTLAHSCGAQLGFVHRLLTEAGTTLRTRGGGHPPPRRTLTAGRTRRQDGKDGRDRPVLAHRCARWPLRCTGEHHDAAAGGELPDIQLPVVDEVLAAALMAQGAAGVRALVSAAGRPPGPGRYRAERPAEVAESCLRGAADALLSLPGAPDAVA